MNYRPLPSYLIYDALKPLVFRENLEKVILDYSGITYENLEDFEKNVCKIDKFIYVKDPQSVSTCLDIEFKDRNTKSVEVYFKEKNRLYVLSPDNFTDYTLDDIVDKTKNLAIVYGRPYSGKSTFNKHLTAIYGFEVLDLVEITKKIKAAKNPDDQDSVELTPKDIVDEVSSIINKQGNQNKRFCLENIINISAQPDYDTVLLLLNSLGRIRVFYNLCIDEKPLILRYKRIALENNTPDDLGESELETYKATLVIHDKIIEQLSQRSVTVIDIDTNNSEAASKSKFDGIWGPKLIVIKHNYDVNLESCLWQLSVNTNALYINVPQLIYSHFYQNKSCSQELRKFYSKKMNLRGSLDINNEIKARYYRYNPIHFEEELVLRLIRQYMSEHYKENEKTGLVIISGYLNSDLLDESHRSFLIPIQEIRLLMTLGSLSCFTQIDTSEIENEEKVQEVFLEPPKKVIKKKNSGVSNNDDDKAADDNQDMGAGDMDQADVDNQDGPKPYNPFGKSWTDYNGKPRNYLQVLKRQIGTEVKNHDFSGKENEAKSFLYQSMESKIKNGELHEKEIYYIKI